MALVMNVAKNRKKYFALLEHGKGLMQFVNKHTWIFLHVLFSFGSVAESCVL